MIGAWATGMYGAMSLTGVIGNTFMLVALIRDEPLQKMFGRILRVLLTINTSVDLLYSLIGVPFYTLTLYFSDWPLWQWPGVCHVVVFSLWQLHYTSQWYLLVLAFTRLLGTVWPVYFRVSVRDSNLWLTVFIVAAPICAWVALITSLLAGWVVVTMAGDFGCTPLPLEGTGDIFYRLEMFSIMALPLGLAVYVVIMFALARKNAKVGHSATSVVVARDSLAHQAGELQRRAKGHATAIKRIRVLAACFAVNMLLCGPSTFVWLSGTYYDLAVSSPLLTELFIVAYLMSGVINPLVYALVSKDIRAAMGRTLGR